MSARAKGEKGLSPEQGADLLLKLLDLVIKHKFELFKLLILLLKVVNAFLLITDCLVAFCKAARDDTFFSAPVK